VDQQFAVLIAGNFATGSDGLSLRLMDGRPALIACSSNCPA
jgi:hypothetical protein